MDDGITSQEYVSYESYEPQWDYAGAPFCCVDVKLDRIAAGTPLPDLGYAPCNEPGREFADPAGSFGRPYYCPRHEHVGRDLGLVPTGETDEIDLQALVPRRWDEPGIRLTVRHVIRLGSGDSALAVDVAARRVNADGRDLKPRHVITVLGRPDETVGDLLRQLARAFDEPGPIPLVPAEEVRT